MKIVVLYQELSGYLLSCIDNFSKKQDASFFIFRKEVNSEAPFEFKIHPEVSFFLTSELSHDTLQKKIASIGPDVILCSGWSNKMYLKICRAYTSKIPVVLCFDNKWKNSFRQKIASVFASRFIQKIFNACWVSGEMQKVFAEKIGFKEDRIFLNLYSADADHFSQLFFLNREAKKKNFPHRFIFAGRYYAFKGIKDLWQAFIELQNESPNDWELWCLGTGDIPPIVHPKIKHFGFVQPKDMGRFILETGVYVLPSRFEPWGVAVHEFAAAGFPLVCSDEVGAAEVFLKDDENGLLFSSGNISELKKALKKIMSMPDDKLFSMGEKSAALALKITPDIWSDTLMSIINKTR